LQSLATIPSAKDRRIALGTIIGQTKSQFTKLERFNQIGGLDKMSKMNVIG
jgi:hypothetical protein